MKKIWIGAGLACVLSLAGCGGGEKTEAPKTAESTPAAGAGGAAAPDEANGGTITGKVAFEGAAPTMKTIDMSANPVCMRAHTTGASNPKKSCVNGNGTLKNAFVWVKAGLPDKNWQVPTTPSHSTSRAASTSRT